MNKSESFYKEKIKLRDDELKFFGFKFARFISCYANKSRVRVGVVKNLNNGATYPFNNFRYDRGQSLAGLRG